MKHVRVITFLAATIVLVAAGCGGGKKVSEAAAAPPSRPAPRARNAACGLHERQPLTSPEVGVTPTTITVTTVADVGSVIKPGCSAGRGTVEGVGRLHELEFGGVAAGRSW
jgi:hypothetical protein